MQATNKKKFYACNGITALLIVTQLLLLHNVCNAEVSEPEETHSPYWITLELLNIEWKPGCLTTAGCAEPRFEVIKTNVITDERKTTSWPVSEKLPEEIDPHKFTSYWKDGFANDITVACEVVGIDPKYKFPRICDATLDSRVFTIDPKQNRSVLPSELEGKVVVELSGKCFNVSLGVQKHEKRCPWCKEHNDVAIVEQYTYPEEAATWLQRLKRFDPFVISTLLFLTLSIVAVAIMLHLCAKVYRLKQSSNIYDKKRRLYHEPPSRIVHPLHINEVEETKYETPWENQHYHPVPYYRLGNRGDATVTSPVDSSLTNATTVSDYGLSSKTTFTSNRRFSPSSSFQGRHDDSGLESV
uniref:Conserved plasma membrane protein n=1 Tax=Syphacia muris TaxID=451379 RepID=A0A0N5AQW0_9BILA